MTIDRAFDHSLPRELSTGFDFTIIDEGLDRVMFAASEMPLDLFADHHFDQHPVLTDGQPDDVLTEEARKGFCVAPLRGERRRGRLLPARGTRR